MVDKFCKKYLPRYIRLWPSWYWLAVWSAPVRYKGNENLPPRNDTAWEALRITIRKDEFYSKCVFVIKKGLE